MVVKGDKCIIAQDLPNVEVRNNTFDKMSNQLKMVINNDKAVGADNLQKEKNVGMST